MLLAGFIALALAWLLPGHYPPWLSFQQELAAASGVFMLALGAMRLKARMPCTWLACAVAIVALIPCLQWMAGQVIFLSDALLASLYLAGFAVSMVVGAALAQERRADFLDGMCGAMVVAALTSAALALCQWQRISGLGIFLVDMPGNAKPYANLAQPNHLATLLGWGACGLLLWYERGRIGGPVVTLALAFLGVALLSTQSRTGWIFVALLVASSVALRRKMAMRLPIPAVLIGGALFALGVAGWGLLNDALMQDSVPIAQRLVPGVRTVIWQVLLDAARHSPWLGYGWTQVGLAQQATALSWAPTHWYFRNSHNLLLDLVLWNGLPLGLLLAALLGWWFVRQWRNCRDAEAYCLLLPVTSLFVHSLFEYPLDYLYFLLPAGLMMGALDAWRGAVAGINRAVFALPAIAVATVATLVVAQYMDVERSARAMRFVSAGIGVDRVAHVPVPDVSLLDAPRELHRLAMTQARPGMTAAELIWMRRTVARYAYPPGMFRLALAEGLNGHPDQAAHELALLCSLSKLEQCEEGRVNWLRMQERYPALRDIPPPSMTVSAVAQP